MNATTNHHPTQQEDGESRQNPERTSRALLAAATGGRLVFTSGATGVTIQRDPALVELYRARFVDHAPSVQVEQEPAGQRPSAGSGQRKVTIHYRHHTPADWLTLWRKPLTVLTLNGSFPWEIEFHGGVVALEADLRGLPLRSLDLGDSRGVRLLLPQPMRTVYIYVSGNASDLTLQRPAGVALRVQIAGSISQVQIDEQHWAVVATGIDWQTPDYPRVTNRYDIRFAGSVSNMMIISFCERN